MEGDVQESSAAGRWIARLWGRVPPKSRFYARTAGYRSERGSMWRWRAALVLPVATLIAFGVVLGYGPDGPACTHAHPCSGPRGWNQPFRGLAEVAARPAVALPIAFFLLICAAWCLRRATLARLAWRGAGIVVPEFREGTILTGYRAAQLTALFRERLAVLRLESASPAPGAAPEGTFVDVIGTPDVTAGNIVGPLLRLLRAAAPTRSIELQVVARERGEAPRFGLTVQIVQVPSQPAPVVEVWGKSWEAAITLAADEATSAILPRCRLCRGPWAGWRGYVMPGGLLNAYEEAGRLEQEARFDEAMGRYREALTLDPTNVTLRLRLGQLEEKAGLVLAALASYLEILGLSRPGARNMPRGVYRRSARLEWERAVLLAKYRALVLLGEGSIVEQWNGVSDAEVTERIFNRDTLHKNFDTRLRPLAERPRGDPAADAICRGVVKLIGRGERDSIKAARADLTHDQALAKRLELASEARQAAVELRRSLFPVRWRPRDKPLTRRNLALARECIALRIEMMEGRDVYPRTLRDHINAAGAGLGWRPWRWRSVWHEHYNAACLYAISLIESLRAGAGELRAERSDVVRAAVQRLELAVRTRDAEFVASWRDWVVSADPDLLFLRRETEFRAFEAMYLPPRDLSRPVDWSHPTYPHRLAECRYACRLLAGVAARRHHSWHTRELAARGDPQPDWHDVRQWGEEDCDLLERVGAVARGEYDWRARLALLKRANELTDAGPMQTRFQLYEQDPIDAKTISAAPGDTRQKQLDIAVAHERERVHESMRALAGYLGEGSDFEQRSRAMRASDPHQARKPALRPLCSHHAQLWQELADWVRDDDERADGARFKTALDAVLDHWVP